MRKASFNRRNFMFFSAKPNFAQINLVFLLLSSVLQKNIVYLRKTVLQRRKVFQRKTRILEKKYRSFREREKNRFFRKTKNCFL